MTRSSVLAIGALVAGLVAFAASAAAQPQTAPAASENPWSHGTTLSVFGGSATDSSGTRGALGGGFGWEINHWVEIEGTGAWVVARHGDDGFAAELKMLANLTRPNTVVPFLGAGIGMYRDVRHDERRRDPGLLSEPSRSQLSRRVADLHGPVVRLCRRRRVLRAQAPHDPPRAQRQAGHARLRGASRDDGDRARDVYHFELHEVGK